MAKSRRAGAACVNAAPWPQEAAPVDRPGRLGARVDDETCLRGARSTPHPLKTQPKDHLLQDVVPPPSGFPHPCQTWSLPLPDLWGLLLAPLR